MSDNTAGQLIKIFVGFLTIKELMKLKDVIKPLHNLEIK